MSCFEGLLEYYTVKDNENDLKTVINFVDLALESDYTVIGCRGCAHELFDNSSVKVSDGDKITVSMPIKTIRKILNGKAEYERGPIVLARDERFGEDIFSL